MKRYLLLLPLAAFAADTWQPFAIDAHVSVQLPVAPTEMKQDLGLPAGAHAYIASTGQEIYQLIGPISIPPEIKLQEATSRQEFYDGIISGMVTDEGNTLLARAAFPTPAGEGIAVTFRVPAAENHKEMLMFDSSFVVGQNSYSLLFLRLDGDTAGSAGPRRRFFSSIAVKP